MQGTITINRMIEGSQLNKTSIIRKKDFQLGLYKVGWGRYYYWESFTAKEGVSIIWGGFLGNRRGGWGGENLRGGRGHVTERGGIKVHNFGIMQRLERKSNKFTGYKTQRKKGDRE